MGVHIGPEYAVNITKKLITALLLLIPLVGCSKNVVGSYTYEPLENVAYTLNAERTSYHSEINSVFLYFELEIKNNSSTPIYIDISKIQAHTNAQSSSATYYDSLASVIPRRELLKNGNTSYKLYFVFSEALMDQELDGFKIIKYGLTKREI